MAAETELLRMDVLQEAADCLKMMAHPARLRIVDALLRREHPVHEIAELCGIAPHQACEHLRLMKGHGFLGSERRGRTVYYRIVSPRLPALLECIRATCRRQGGPSEAGDVSGDAMTTVPGDREGSKA